jgi:hypothetical protein
MPISRRRKYTPMCLKRGCSKSTTGSTHATSRGSQLRNTRLWERTSSLYLYKHYLHRTLNYLNIFWLISVNILNLLFLQTLLFDSNPFRFLLTKWSENGTTNKFYRCYYDIGSLGNACIRLP